MKDLVNHILSSMLETDDFEIKEEVEDRRTDYEIFANPSEIGLIIGKGGKTIRAIRNLLKVRATLEKVSVNIRVSEKK